MPDPTDLRPGERLGDFLVERVLGHGAMGVVYEAVQLGLGRRVALKVITPLLARDPSFQARFRREAETMASLQSRHVVTVHLVGESEGRLFMASELLPDGDLGALISRTGALPVADALAVAEQVAEGLSDVHRSGVVHRDVKPANVLLRATDNGWQAFLGDFGIVGTDTSQLTATGVSIGTPAYMSPETHLGGPATPASDVYALGCLLWAALTGRPPFVAPTQYALVQAHLDTAPPPLGVGPRTLEQLLGRMLAKDPAARPSAVLARTELAAIRAAPPGDGARPPAPPASTAPTEAATPPAPTTHAYSPPGPEAPGTRRRPVEVAATVAIVLAVVAGVVLAVVLGVQGAGGDDDPARTAAATSPQGSETEPSETSSAPTEESTGSTAPSAPDGVRCDYDRDTSGADSGGTDATLPPSRSPEAAIRTVVLTTPDGPVEISVDTTTAPCTVNSFLSLTDQGFYDDTGCHRLTTEGIFILQCGDPIGNGGGGPGYSFADELTGEETYPRGTVAMANSGADTNGSQFFIVYEDSPLPPSYTVFGTVSPSTGLEIIDGVVADGVVDGATDGPPAGDFEIFDATAF